MAADVRFLAIISKTAHFTIKSFKQKFFRIKLFTTFVLAIFWYKLPKKHKIDCSGELYEILTFWQLTKCHSTQSRQNRKQDDQQHASFLRQVENGEREDQNQHSLSQHHSELGYDVREQQFCSINTIYQRTFQNSLVAFQQHGARSQRDGQKEDNPRGRKCVSNANSGKRKVTTLTSK